jgi:hypothetical protein
MAHRHLGGGFHFGGAGIAAQLHRAGHQRGQCRGHIVFSIDLKGVLLFVHSLQHSELCKCIRDHHAVFNGFAHGLFRACLDEGFLDDFRCNILG